MSVAAVLREIAALSSAERVEANVHPTDRLPGGEDAISLKLAAEPERRVAWADANPGVGYSWEDVYARLKGNRSG